MTGLTRQILVCVLTVLMLASNLLSGHGGGFTDQPGDPAVYFLYPTRFSPAPFTFLIWFPIYIGTVVLAIYQSFPAQRRSALLDRMAIPYAIALIANALTPFTVLGISNLVVLVLFLALLATYAVLGDQFRTWPTQIFVSLPVAMFATWAGLATIVNACQLVVAMGGTIGEITAAALVVVAMGIGLLAIIHTREIVIAGVMAWAGIGLATTNADAPIILVTIALTTAMTLLVTWRYGAAGASSSPTERG